MIYVWVLKAAGRDRLLDFGTVQEEDQNQDRDQDQHQDQHQDQQQDQDQDQDQHQDQIRSGKWHN